MLRETEATDGDGERGEKDPVRPSYSDEARDERPLPAPAAPSPAPAPEPGALVLPIVCDEVEVETVRRRGEGERSCDAAGVVVRLARALR